MLIIGTANRKKGHELADLFKPVGVELKTLADFPGVAPVLEDGATFAANAALKAAGYARQLHRWVLADDSGLLVDALRGEPGVISARFAGEDASDEENNRLFLGAWAKRPPKSARPSSSATWPWPIRKARSKPRAMRRAAAGFFSRPGAKTALATIRFLKS